MTASGAKQILVAPLDWGLGHTARCISLIQSILKLGHHPVIACNDDQQSFLAATFPAIRYVNLFGYGITYSGSNRWLQAGLLAQLPHILGVIDREHEWLQQLAGELHIDGIISDNRYGLYSGTIPSVIITHQLRVLTGMGRFADLVLQKIHYRYLHRFGSVWVVDTPAHPGLAGRLSHPDIMPRNYSYIGPLSRFVPPVLSENTGPNLVVLLSGPEPQRTALSRLLWKQLPDAGQPIVFVEGSSACRPPGLIPARVRWHARLSGDELASVLDSAGMIICRSGYSTIMDLIALGKKAILVPTPGQTEQLYLAAAMQHRGIFYSEKQAGFRLQRALSRASLFPFHRQQPIGQFAMYEPVLQQWIAGL